MAEPVQPGRGHGRTGDPAADSSELPGDVLRYEDLTLDEARHEVFRSDAQLQLTATEFALLRFFLLDPRRVLSKAQILQNVWRYDFRGNSNFVETTGSSAASWTPPARRSSETVRQAGYMLAVQPHCWPAVAARAAPAGGSRADGRRLVAADVATYRALAGSPSTARTARSRTAPTRSADPGGDRRARAGVAVNVRRPTGRPSLATLPTIRDPRSGERRPHSFPRRFSAHRARRPRGALPSPSPRERRALPRPRVGRGGATAMLVVSTSLPTSTRRSTGCS